jgi:hypothetical protein
MKRLANGDQWKEDHAVRLMFLTVSVCYPSKVVANVEGPYTRYEDQLHSLE